MHAKKRTNKLMRFSCQMLGTDAPLCIEPAQLALWFAFTPHSAWSNIYKDDGLSRLY
jgi:hypothetical protein